MTRKENCNLGKSYVTESGKQLIVARKFKSLDVCRQKCKDHFTDVDRLNIFNEYWQLGSSKRSTYISGLIVLKKTDYHRKKVLDQQHHIAIETGQENICM